MTDLFKCITTSICALCLLTFAIGGCGTLTGATVGGAAGAGGTGGLGQGGGLYNQIGAVARADGDTRIIGNNASTSDDDVFGVVTPI